MARLQGDDFVNFISANRHHRGDNIGVAVLTSAPLGARVNDLRCRYRNLLFANAGILQKLDDYAVFLLYRTVQLLQIIATLLVCKGAYHLVGLHLPLAESLDRHHAVIGTRSTNSITQQQCTYNKTYHQATAQSFVVYTYLTRFFRFFHTLYFLYYHANVTNNPCNWLIYEENS